MPQMKPFHWTFMLMLTVSLLILLSSIIYYSSYPFINKSNKSSMSTQIFNILWNWKW